MRTIFILLAIFFHTRIQGQELFFINDSIVNNCQSGRVFCGKNVFCDYLYGKDVQVFELFMLEEDGVTVTKLLYLSKASGISVSKCAVKYTYLPEDFENFSFRKHPPLSFEILTPSKQELRGAENFVSCTKFRIAGLVNK